jgi:hypothetical protein
VNLKKNRKVFTNKFVGAGPSSYKERIYRAAVSQRSRNSAIKVEIEKGKVAHVLAMKKCRGSSGIVPLIFNLDPS